MDDVTGLRLQQAAGAVAAVDEDQCLVNRAQAGDVRAFEALVRRHERWVFTLALRMVGNRGDAEDVAQEVFLKAYRGLSGFRGGSRFSTWLYAIARRIPGSGPRLDVRRGSGLGSASASNGWPEK